MNKVATLTITLLNILLAQSIDMDKFKNMKARSIGPAGMSGRVTAIDVVLSNTDVMYVGTGERFGNWVESGSNWYSPGASAGIGMFKLLIKFPFS